MVRTLRSASASALEQHEFSDDVSLAHLLDREIGPTELPINNAERTCVRNFSKITRRSLAINIEPAKVRMAAPPEAVDHVAKAYQNIDARTLWRIKPVSNLQVPHHGCRMNLKFAIKSRSRSAVLFIWDARLVTSTTRWEVRSIPLTIPST